MSIGGRIKEQRLKQELTLEDLSKRAGVSRQTIFRYEKGEIKNIPSDKIELIASGLNVSPGYLMGWEPNAEPVHLRPSHDPHAGCVRIPVLGRVAAGIPIEQIEDIEDFEDIKAPEGSGAEYFALRIRGDSMQPLIQDGSVVIVHKQPDAETGEIVIATVNGDDATCKRLKKYAEGIMLVSINPAYDPMVFEKNDVNSLPVSILGKVIEVRTTL